MPTRSRPCDGPRSDPKHVEALEITDDEALEITDDETSAGEDESGNGAIDGHSCVFVDSDLEDVDDARSASPTDTPLVAEQKSTQVKTRWRAGVRRLIAEALRVRRRTQQAGAAPSFFASAFFYSYAQGFRPQEFRSQN